MTTQTAEMTMTLSGRSAAPRVGEWIQVGARLGAANRVQVTACRVMRPDTEGRPYWRAVVTIAW